MTSHDFNYCDVFRAVMFIQRDNQLVKKLNKPASDVSDAGAALFIRLVFNPSPYDSYPLHHTSKSQQPYI